MLRRSRRSPPAATGLSRRQLLSGGAAAVGGGLLAGGLSACGGGGEAATTAGAHAAHAAGGAHGGHAAANAPLRALSRREAEILTAMVDRVFPAGDGTPSASEVGVVAYIDGQLAGGFGSGDRFYRDGPFHEPTDSGHGYQLPLVPRELYRRVLPKIDDYAQARHGAPLAQLDEDDQDAVLRALEADRVDLGLADSSFGFTAAQFFAVFLQNVREGLFADPMYGGNRDVAGWRWIGYPGDPMAYGDVYYAVFDSWDVEWDVEPQGMEHSG